MLTQPNNTPHSGHKHCNVVMDPDVGFMVGGNGMSDAASCGGNFGIPVIDTTGMSGDRQPYLFLISKFSFI